MDFKNENLVPFKNQKQLLQRPESHTNPNMIQIDSKPV